MRLVTCLLSMIVTLGIASLACGEAGPPAKAPEAAAQAETDRSFAHQATACCRANQVRGLLFGIAPRIRFRIFY